jgi:ActR/RegA family two-component response regulator
MRVRSDVVRRAALYDDATTRHAVAAALQRFGFTVKPLYGFGQDVMQQVHAESPALVVFDLASGGRRGLRVVADLKAVTNGAVLLLAPFEGLRLPAQGVGAYDLVGKDDLRDLERCLRRLRAELDAKDNVLLRSHPDVFGDPRGHWKG